MPNKYIVQFQMENGKWGEVQGNPFIGRTMAKDTARGGSRDGRFWRVIVDDGVYRGTMFVYRFGKNVSVRN